MPDFDLDVQSQRTQSTLPAFDAPKTATLPIDGLPLAEDGAEARCSRRDWLGLSLAACGAALAMATSPAHAIVHPDAQALRFLEEMEAMQSNFWTRAAASAATHGMEGRERDVIYLIANQDREHKEWFHLARRKFGVSEFGHFYTPNTSQSRPVRTFTFPAQAFASRGDLFPLGQMLKDTSVAAYHGMVGRTSNGDLTQAVAALAGIEGRHAAALREIAGITPLPDAFEAALGAQVVARRLESYGFRGEAVR